MSEKAKEFIEEFEALCEKYDVKLRRFSYYYDGGPVGDGHSIQVSDEVLDMVDLFDDRRVIDF